MSVDLFCLQQEMWKGVSYERRMLGLIPWAFGLLDWLLISDRFSRVQFGLLEFSCSGISDGASIVSAQVIAGDQILPLSKPPLLWGGFSWSMTTLTAAAQSNSLTSCWGQPISANRPRQLRLCQSQTLQCFFSSVSSPCPAAVDGVRIPSGVRYAIKPPSRDQGVFTWAVVARNGQCEVDGMRQNSKVFRSHSTAPHEERLGAILLCR